MKSKARHLFSLFVSLAAAVPLAAQLTTTGERGIFTGPDHDIEPVIVTQVRSGVEHQASVWTQFVGGNTRFYYNHYNTAQVTYSSMFTVPGYGQYAHPQLAENRSSAAPLQRIYLVGVGHNDSEGLQNGIFRWYSDDGGETWSGPAAVIEYTNLVSHYVNYPSVAVSPGGASAGWVYVLHTTKSNSNGLHQLMLSVSMDGGATFAGPFAVNSPSYDYPIGRVVVDSNGNVYVVWAMFLSGTDEIRASKSPAYDPSTGMMNFGLPIAVSAGDLRESAINCGAGCGLSARSVPDVALHQASRRIGVVWHSVSGNGTVVKYRSIDISTVVPAWQQGTTFPNLNNQAHHLQPAIDFDAAGDAVVAYYTVPLYTGTYTQQARYITFAGATPMMGATAHSFSGNANSITALPIIGGVFTRTLGDYHDIHYSNGTFKTIGLEVRPSYTDPYVFTTIH